MKPMKPMEPMKPMKPLDKNNLADWVPAGLTHPSSTGAQDGMRYAFFPDQKRLVVDEDGVVTQYDTGTHRITGVSQQQSGRSGAPSFTSQHGEIDLSTLRKVG